MDNDELRKLANRTLKAGNWRLGVNVPDLETFARATLTLLDRVEALEEALKPFARAFEEICQYKPEDKANIGVEDPDMRDTFYTSKDATFSDLRRAAELLNH